MKGRTYRYFDGDPLFSFGFGLSYTTFAYRSLRTPAQANAGDPVTVTVEVENTGKMAGEEVVQLYLKPPARPGGPLRSLEGFERVALRPAERKTLTFHLAPRQFSTPGANGKRAVGPGNFTVSVGGATTAIRFNGPAREVN
jgi:beta-glucosidase